MSQKRSSVWSKETNIPEVWRGGDHQSCVDVSICLRSSENKGLAVGEVGAKVIRSVCVRRRLQMDEVVNRKSIKPLLRGVFKETYYKVKRDLV